MKRILLLCMPLILYIFLMQLLSGSDLNLTLYDIKYWFEHELEFPDLFGHIKGAAEQLKSLKGLVEGMKFTDVKNVGDFLLELSEVIINFGFIGHNVLIFGLTVAWYTVSDSVLLAFIPIDIISYFIG